jgi:two-component system OmpR family response regulator
MRVLLIEDDAETVGFLVASLEEAGCRVVHAADGTTGLEQVLEGGFDVAVVDRMLSGLDDLTLVRSFRSAGARVPTLFLTTMSGVDDRVEGLEAGADDYLVKPFAFVELLARLNALVRRPPLSEPGTRLRVADMEMDLITRTVRRSGELIDLRPREFQLLEYLLRNAGNVVTRGQLLEKVWDFHFDPTTNIVESHMSRLRGKVDRGFDRPLIDTIRGIGYILRGNLA